jgi:hypothetical protein
VKEEPDPDNSSNMGKNHEAGSGKEEDAMQLAVAKQQYGEHMDSLRAEVIILIFFNDIEPESFLPSVGSQEKSWVLGGSSLG